MLPPVLVWLRNDLRLRDNPALFHATGLSRPVIPVYIWSPVDEYPWAPGGAQKWWLHHSLTSFQQQLSAIGSSLIIRTGPSGVVIEQLVQETGADTVYFNDRFEPHLKQVDRTIESALESAGIRVVSFQANFVHDPVELKTTTGRPFQVFTPFWNALRGSVRLAEPLPAPGKEMLPAPDRWPESIAIDQLNLYPRPDWSGGLQATWTPGEPGALGTLRRFVDTALYEYKEGRDIPGQPFTSRLSPYLHFGEISIREVWLTVARAPREAMDSRSAYLRELAWREFACHLLHHFPHTVDQPLHRKFERFQWRTDEEQLERWQRGQTGYPIVDAGMRELWRTGWMHNRVRMIVASFLTKHLLIPWQKGTHWFWDTLVDADLASNTLGWQWTAGCGADAQPYFRIFNPILQGEKFDADGQYVRRWVPELNAMPDRYIHKPWAAPESILRAAGIVRGKTYPDPIVDHKMARNRALNAYYSIQSP